MNFDSYTLSNLFEKSLIRLTADFESSMEPRSVVSGLSKSLNTKISTDEPSSYNFQLKRGEDGIYKFTTSFLTYRDSRLTIIGLLKWIERNGETSKSNSLLIDLKFLDEQKGPFKGTLFSTGTKIDNIDRLKYILEFDEDKVYSAFPLRKNAFNAQSIKRIEATQKFIPREKEFADPRLYQIPSTSSCGINFETLNQGFLRMQYIGGVGYEKKVDDILSILNQFTITAWECTVNRGLTKENISKFEKIASAQKKIREAFYDYQIFKKNFPGVKFTVDLVSNPTVLDSYYSSLKERIFEIFSNIEIKSPIEFNYDTTLSVFQFKDGKIECKNITGLEIVKCEIDKGTFDKCDFYDCNIKDATLYQCNLFLHTEANQCVIFDSYANRTTILNGCDFNGMNGVLNSQMKGGIFRNGKLGVFADISNNTTVIQYQRLKTGYMVAGDQILIPTKKFRSL